MQHIHYLPMTMPEFAGPYLDKAKKHFLAILRKLGLLPEPLFPGRLVGLQKAHTLLHEVNRPVTEEWMHGKGPQAPREFLQRAIKYVDEEIAKEMRRP